MSDTDRIDKSRVEEFNDGTVSTEVRSDYRTKRRDHRKSILIVEDEPLNRQVITRYFGLLGFRVLQADRGDVGLSVALAEAPDVILLDNQLPGMNGIELCRQLREHKMGTPVMLMSAYELSSQNLKEAQELGVRSFLRKPFAFNHLKDVLRFATRKPRLGLGRKKYYYRKPHFSLTARSLAQHVFNTIFREGLDMAGHVHFHVRNHPDHLILLCNRKSLGKVVAKSPECGEGECIPWDMSTFYAYNQEKVLKELNQDIIQVRIDAADYQMSWPTLADFICWLELSY
jgi:CheY-like chemotaxis protein